MDLIGLVNKFKHSILNLIIILVAIMVAKGIYEGQEKKIFALREQQANELKKNKILEEISTLEKKVKVFKETINNKDINSVINTVGSLAKDSSVTIISFKPQQERDYPAYVIYSFDLYIAANKYHHIGKFISALESSSDIYIIEKISMDTQQRQGNEGKITAQVTLDTVLVKD